MVPAAVTPIPSHPSHTVVASIPPVSTVTATHAESAASYTKPAGAEAVATADAVVSEAPAATETAMSPCKNCRIIFSMVQEKRVSSLRIDGRMSRQYRARGQVCKASPWAIRGWRREIPFTGSRYILMLTVETDPRSSQGMCAMGSI